MAVTVLDGASGAVAAPQKPTPQPAGHYATTAADIPSARVAARLSGQQVEALSERSETSTTWVNANGSLTTELSAGPIRFKDNGQWRPVDLDLVQGSDGSIAPKAHPRGLKLAGEGGVSARSLADAGSAPARDLVTLGAGDQQIALQWKGGLPKPALSGNRATYVNAVPGANVVVEATRTGFEQYVDIAQRPAAGGFAYTLPLKTKGLTVKQLADGSLQFADGKNNKQAVMPAPTMWDAQIDPVSGEHTHQASVALKVVAHKGSVDLVFTPDAKFLADPATKFPVTVDPSTATLGNVFDTYAQQGVTVDESADTELDLGNPGTTNTDGTPRTARSFITWNTAPIADALVSSATLSLWDFHAGNNVDCKPYPWEVWDVDKASTSTRWPAQPVWHTKSATSTETRGNPSCTAAPDGWINADVTTLAQTWASLKSATSGMGLRASSETVVAQWKRVNSANAATNPPKLTVTYNYRPRTGTDQQAGPPYFKDTAGTWQVNTLTPTLRDTFADPNNDKVDGTFQIFDNTTGTQVGNLLVSPYVPAGQPASVTVPAGVLTNGKTYKFRTNSYDGTHYNLGWSPYALFTVDTSAPSAPTSVTSTDYPSNAWVKGVGQAGNFTINPPAGDQNGVEWSLDGATWTKIVTGGSTTAVTATIKPTKAGTNTLQVRSTDRAENKSEAVNYVFHVGPGGVTSPDDGTHAAARIPLVAEADGTKYDKVTFSWRRGDADAWTAIPVTDVTNAGQPVSSWPVGLTAGKSPQLAWNAASTVNPDGAVQLRADLSGPANANASSDAVNVVVDRNADGAASQDIGPGSLNLLTGSYTLSSTDVSVFDMTVTRSASSRSPQAGAAIAGQAPIFGKEWLYGTAADQASTPFSFLHKTSPTSLSISRAGDDTQLHFTANTANTGWVPEQGAEGYTLTGGFSSNFTVKSAVGEVTTFTPVGANATTWQPYTSYLDGVSDSTTTTVSETLTLGGTTTVRPKKIIAATSAVAASVCEANPTVKGCRVLEFVYASSTTATGTVFGDFKDQVSSVQLWATAPGAAAGIATTIARYAYDDSGRLREVWDPRVSPALKTSYAYDSAGRATSLTPPGQLPWTFVYGQVGSSPTSGAGMLLDASRPTLTPGSASQTNGTATTSVVYGVPLTGSTAPQDLGAQATASWGQTDLPTDATALFPADQVPATHDGTSLTAADYQRAGIHYLNASGREVNQVTPGNHIAVTEYDSFGHTIRSLAASNRELALGSTPAQMNQLTDLGINALGIPERAQLLSTTSVFNATGTQETHTYGPLHTITLAANLVRGSTTVATAGSRMASREHTVREYDVGRPTDGTAAVRDQVTKETKGAQPRSEPDLMADPRVTSTGYDWVIGLATSTTQDPGGLAITTTTAYDARGRTNKSTQAASAGNDAGTMITTYYSASGTGLCAGKPEWADLVCQTAPAGAITGGGSNPSQLPTKTNEYNQYGQVTKATDTANGITRTTTTGYDGAGRPTTVAVAGGSGIAVPTVTTSYDSATGLAFQQTSTSGTITKAFDQLGRQRSYTDADGGLTSAEFDSLDRISKVADSVPSTTTFTYDTSIDPRGLATTVSDSVAGTFTARYDAEGALTTETLPGGYTMAEEQDPVGAVISRVYTRNSDGTVVLADNVATTVHGQWATHSGSPGVTASQAFSYDKAGRLSEVQDTSTAAICTTRSYTFDKNTNRKSVASATAAVNADCSPTGGTSTPYTYDSADRLVNSGYGYDAFGRTTSAPGATLAYFTNDMVQQETFGTQRQTWAMDSALRFRSWTTEANNAGTWTQTGSKINHYDSDGDNPRWIIEDTATGALTRNVRGLDGNLAATTTKTGGAVLQLTNLHGDVALQLPLDTAVAPVVLDSDEYGNPRSGQAATRYDWLGGKQRSGDTPSGLTLMGARLYDPTSGRFLSADPVYGGNANSYEYCTGDPVGCTDLSGCTSVKRCGITYPVSTGWFPVKIYGYYGPGDWMRPPPWLYRAIVTFAFRGFITDVRTRFRMILLRQWRCHNRHYQERLAWQVQVQGRITFGYGWFSYNQTTPWLYTNMYYWIGPVWTYS
ncbi:RHS repeat-associated core domain-containing protein [Streptomyces sp. So13.3]|uniref:RHS repeat-associated core domain-containing protein n=1 Tax=Streptomyces sp. So13.3 TaxID=2136173 RepID=UPI001105B45A|nr:RHS repeat-associated core domain-containing protein [Streptomyces sp. So13.3]QNA75393.1 RHS repeat-associated core domain-containing protein [Streptomyces sp. So13.3]